MKKLLMALRTCIVLISIIGLVKHSNAQDYPVSYISSAGAKNPLTVFAFSLSEQNNETSMSYWLLAAQEDSLGNADGAIKYLDSCILYDELNGDAYVQRARLQFDMNRPYLAMRDIRIAEKLTCSSYFFPVSAWLKLFTGDTLGLATDIKQNLFFFPDDGFTYILSSIYKLVLEDTSCLSDLAKAIRLDDQVNYRFFEMALLLEIEDLDTRGELLLRKCDTLIERSRPDTGYIIEACLYKIRVLEYLERDDEIAIYVNMIYDLEPLDSRLCLILGSYYSDKGILDRGRLMAERAAQFEPEDPFVLFECAKIFLAVGDTQHCLSILDTLIAQYPTGDVYLERSGIYESKGDIAQADIDFEKALELFEEERRLGDKLFNEDEQLLLFLDSLLLSDPKNAFFRSERGNVLIRLHRFKEAVTDFDAAILIEPENASHYVSRGTAKYSLGDYKGGCADFRKAESLMPGSAKSIIKESCQGY